MFAQFLGRDMFSEVCSYLIIWVERLYRHSVELCLGPPHVDEWHFITIKVLKYTICLSDTTSPQGDDERLRTVYEQSGIYPPVTYV